jgi:gamma-glutamyltranspeptidase / glutathione hydrolase
VASAAPAATDAGLAILASGGNAADAAVATALALAVVHPMAGNLGGGGFAVVRTNGTVRALDFRETAPAAATPGMFLGPSGDPVPDASLVGPLATGVPGSPAGLFELHRRLGRLPWAEVVAPAVRLARDGFTVTPRLHDEIVASHSLLARFPETAAVWLAEGQAPAAGSVMKLPRLAAALAAYAERGPEALTTGAGAAAIVAASRRYGGVLTVEDLASYRPVWRDPIVFSAFGWEVASMPLPSSGGIILAQTAGILERLHWAALPRGSVERVHLLAEAWRRSYADRFLLGDPVTSLASAAQLLDPAWLARRASEIDRSRATPSSKVAPWARPAADRGDTTHLSVVDRDGNAVGLTTTLNGSFGCGLLVPDLGIMLNNEMDDFAIAPGKPNLYGLVQGRANAVGPGKRMLSSMAPTVAWRGSEVLVLGSPGGSRIPTAVAQVFLAVAVEGEGLQTAVARPRVHHQWLPDELRYEEGALDGDQRHALAARGHTLRSIVRVGEVDAVRRGADGTLEAAADPRGPGGAGLAP